MPSERSQLIGFFRSVDAGDVVALPPDRNRFDQSTGHHEAREVAARRGIEQPQWLFWHTQAGAVFDAEGRLTSGLRISWGGDHSRIAAVLAGLPAPFEVVDHGPGGVFEIISTETPARAAAPFPDVGDTPAVRARIRLVTATRAEDRTDAEWAWLNEVLVAGDVDAQGAVVRHLADSDRMGEPALEALMANWAQIYSRAPKDVLVWRLLSTLHRRADPRLEEVIAVCATRKRWTFQAGLAHFLDELGDPGRLPLLHTLAQTPGRYAHTPGNAPALRGYVRIRAAQQGRSIAEVAGEALSDPSFDVAARRGLQRMVELG